MKGKKILITGGTGSIGIELAKKILKERPSNIRILSNSENSIFELKKIFGKNPTFTYLLGDIRDKDRLKLAIRGIDIVFHGAAMKRVDVCEENPFDAVKVNVLGTSNILEASLLEDVSRFILISTEKATNSLTTMGASKFLAERLTLNSGSYRGKGKIVFSVIRLGNVIGSKGSVSQIFLENIKKNFPLEVPNKTTTKFVISIPDAVAFILKISKIGKDSEVYIPKMSTIRIYDLAKKMIQYYNEFSKTKKKIVVKELKNNQIEKTEEYLIPQEEQPFCYEVNDMFKILRKINKKSIPYERFSSFKAKMISDKKLKVILMNLIQEEL